MPDWLSIALAAILGVAAMTWMDGRSRRPAERRRREKPDLETMRGLEIEIAAQGMGTSAGPGGGSGTPQRRFWDRLFDTDGDGGDGGGGGD